jgi:hypothetical protein
LGSVCAVRPNASIHTASISSTGHLLGGTVIGCPEEEEDVENKCNDGIQLRMSLIEHGENEVDDEGILFLN